MLFAYSIEGEKCIHSTSFLWPWLLSVLVCINPLCRFEEALRKKNGTAVCTSVHVNLMTIFNVHLKVS